MLCLKLPVIISDLMMFDLKNNPCTVIYYRDFERLTVSDVPLTVSSTAVNAQRGGHGRCKRHSLVLTGQADLFSSAKVFCLITVSCL